MCALLLCHPVLHRVRAKICDELRFSPRAQGHRRSLSCLPLANPPITLVKTTMGLLPQLTGTYDVLCIPLVLPRSTVEALLPTQWRHASPSLLLKTPDELNQLAGESGLEERKEGEEPHLVLLQLGHQKGTGPGPFKMTFQEAKLEIPFVRHPKLPEDSQKAFLFKQKW